LLGTVDKAGRVLDLFTTQQPEWGVTETAGALDLPRSSAHDLLATLVETGLLRRSGRNRYQLGWKVLALSRTVLATSNLRVHARPVIRALASRLGATVHLATLDDGEVMYIDKLAPRGSLAVPVSAVGGTLPPHCSAVGKALLAHQPRSAVTDALERCGMHRYTERTNCSIDTLSFELARIRERGTARDREETVEGLCCHAAPIFDGGCAVAAISVCVPSSVDARFAERYAGMARAAGTQISRALQRADDERVSQVLAG
jgi:DNA-binding IclR family transcriptional regulator